MIDIEGIATTISTLKGNDTALDVLMEIEELFDESQLYVYANWLDGEVIRGPEITRHWVEVEMMYPKKLMPDPDGALRLIKKGCHVFYREDKLTSTVKIKTNDDLEFEPIMGKVVPKKEVSAVYVVKVAVPRHLISNQQAAKVNADSEVTTDDLVDSYDTEVEDQADEN